MLEPEQLRLLEIRRSDKAFLTKVGIKPCVIRCFRPRYPAVKLTKEHTPGITEKDIDWLGECGVTWERKPAVQLSLNFGDSRMKEHDQKEPASQRKEGFA